MENMWDDNYKCDDNLSNEFMTQQFYYEDNYHSEGIVSYMLIIMILVNVRKKKA